jgi:hypothetical protein
MFSPSRRRAELVPTWPAQGQGHQWCLNILTMYFVSGSYLLNPWNEYHETSEMFSPSRRCAEPMFQPGWLMVKATCGVLRFEPCIFCPVHIF